MSKAKNTAETTETTEVIKQAQAAANDEPVLTPSENAATQELTQPTLDAIDNQTASQLQNLKQEILDTKDRILITKDFLKNLEKRAKELDEQYLDALKAERTPYVKIVEIIVQEQLAF